MSIILPVDRSEKTRSNCFVKNTGMNLKPTLYDCVRFVYLRSEETIRKTRNHGALLKKDRNYAGIV